MQKKNNFHISPGIINFIILDIKMADYFNFNFMNSLMLE